MLKYRSFLGLLASFSLLLIACRILESVTAREYAEIDENGVRSKEQVEPLTNYFVARASQDLNKGNTVFGGMITSIHRDINTTSLEF